MTTNKKDGRSKNGGANRGAGRKTGKTFKPPTATYPIRHDKAVVDALKAKYGRKLQGMGKEWLNSLL